MGLEDFVEIVREPARGRPALVERPREERARHYRFDGARQGANVGLPR
jgi:hypothetical protein